MGQITGIEAKKRNKKRASIFVDGEFFINLESATVEEHRLEIGKIIDEAEFKAIALEADTVGAYNRALELLAGISKPEHVMRKTLLGKGYCSEAVEIAIEKLKSNSYIDDAEYVRGYIRMYEKKEGMNKIRYELIGKGISTELIAEIFENMPESDEQSCMQNAEKYMQDKEINIKNRERLVRLLYSKGYKTEEIYNTVRRIMGKVDEE